MGERKGYGKCKTCPKHSGECERVHASRNCSSNFHGINETLCWCCANALPGVDRETGHERGCEWSLYKQPVPGWDATREDIPMNDKMLRSYRVFDCPKFERG